MASFIVGDGEGRTRYILCFNPKEAKRQRKHREENITLLDEKLKSHPNQMASAQWALELLASRRFKRHLRVTKAGKICIDKKAIKEAAKCTVIVCLTD